MLNQLTIRNYVLVDELDISFPAGLTGITGESGAGKSILLGALGLLMGDRAKADSVRPGADKADISAEFGLRPGSPVHAKLHADELIEEEDDSCLVRRVVTTEGRSRAFINNVPVTLGYLKEISEHLVDIQDQNQHQRLADRSVQRDMLDEFAETKTLATEVAQLWHSWRTSQQEIQRLEQLIATQNDRKTLLGYQLEEFATLDIASGELETLEAEHKRLSQAQTILSQLAQVQSSLEQLDAVRQAAKIIESIDDNHSSLEAGVETLNSALSLVDDAARDLRHYEDQVVVDPQALADTQARLEQIYDLARKHKIQPEQLHEHAAALQAEFDGIAADRAALNSLTVDAQTQREAYLAQGKKLSSARRKSTDSFTAAIDQHIHALGIKDGAMSVVFHEQESESGLEQAEFFVQTNKRFEPGPLNRIASGGEQTRINLAIQIVAAQRSELPCLILDEADVGVGGTTQVAARSHNHMCVSKKGAQTQITPLSQDQRIEELARMLAGADVTKKTRDYAKTLLSEASRDA